MRRFTVQGVRFELLDASSRVERVSSTVCPVCTVELRVKPIGMRHSLEAHLAECLGSLAGTPTAASERGRYPSTNLEAILRAEAWNQPSGKRYFVRCRRR